MPPTPLPARPGRAPVLEVIPVGHHEVAAPGEPPATQDLDEPRVLVRWLAEGVAVVLQSNATPQVWWLMPPSGSG